MTIEQLPTEPQLTNLLDRPFDAPGGYFVYKGGVGLEHTDGQGAPAGGNALAVTASNTTIVNNNGGIRIPLSGSGITVGNVYRIRYWTRAIDSPGRITFSHQNGQGGSTTLSHGQTLTTEWELYERTLTLDLDRTQLYVWSNGANGPGFRFALDGLTIQLVQPDVLVTLPSNTDSDRFAYDKASRLLSANSERFGNQLAFAYNDDSTLQSETITGIGGGPAGYTVGRDYDADNRLTRITHPDGTRTVRTYTDRDQLATVSYDGDLES